jgi:Lon protease-like protein
VRVDLSPDPSQGSFEAAAMAPFGPLDAQRVLEADSALSRLAVLETLLGDEIQVLEARKSG